MPDDMNDASEKAFARIWETPEGKELREAIVRENAEVIRREEEAKKQAEHETPKPTPDEATP